MLRKVYHAVIKALKMSCRTSERVENEARARSGAGKCSCDEAASRTVESQMSSEPCGSRPPYSIYSAGFRDGWPSLNTPFGWVG